MTPGFICSCQGQDRSNSMTPGFICQGQDRSNKMTPGFICQGQDRSNKMTTGFIGSCERQAGFICSCRHQKRSTSGFVCSCSSQRENKSNKCQRSIHQVTSGSTCQCQSQSSKSMTHGRTSTSTPGGSPGGSEVILHCQVCHANPLYGRQNVIKCNAQHVSCYSCFKSWVKKSNNNNNTCNQQLVCYMDPNQQCQKVLDAKYFSWLPMDIQKESLKKTLGTFADELILCTCGYGFFADGTSGRISCPSCRKVSFCIQCKKQSHLGSCIK